MIIAQGPLLFMRAASLLLGVAAPKGLIDTILPTISLLVMKGDRRTRLLVVGVLQVDDRVAGVVAVDHLFVVVNRECVRGAKVYPEVVVVIGFPICVRSKQ